MRLVDNFKIEPKTTNRSDSIDILTEMIDNHVYNESAVEYQALEIALKALLGWEVLDTYLVEKAKHYEGKPSWDDFFSGGLEAVDDLNDFIKEYWREDE